MAFWRRLINRWRERSLAREFDEEIAFHLNQRAERNRRLGMTDTEARAEARRHFGNRAIVREDMRDARVLGWIDRRLADVRYAVRIFSRQPTRTGIVLLTLSLAIGANTAVFSVLHAVMFRPFPFADADRLVSVVERLRSGGGTSPTIPEILDLRARSRTLDIVTFFDTRDFQVEGGAEPVRVLGMRADPALLPLLGATPAHGRLLTTADSAEGSPDVLLLSDGVWRRNFGGDPAVVGRPFVVNGTAHTIVGILAPGFTVAFLPSAPDIYVPYPMSAAYALRSGEFANVRRVRTIARVAAGVPRGTVSAELAALAGALATEHPALYTEFGGAANFVIDVEPLRASVGDGNRAPLLLLFGAVALVLVIGCANTAQFLLAHAIERRPEVALRAALGASRSRLLGQFLSETAVLSGAAAAFGILQAIWMAEALQAWLPAMPMVGAIEVDLAVLAFAIAIALATTAICGIVPALRYSRVGLRASLDSRSAIAGRGRSRQVLVAVQAALSVLLLIQAVLLFRTLQTMQTSQAGFGSADVTAMRVRGMGAGTALGATYAQYLDRVSRVPEVAAAAMSSSVLPGFPGTPFTVVGQPVEASAQAREPASYQIVSPDYFAVLRIPLRRGRTFAPTDDAASTPVALVNEELVRRHLAGRAPIGQRIRAGSGPRDATMTIVGVVGNVRSVGQPEDVPQLYVSYLQQAEPNMFVLVRAAPGATPPVEAVKRAIWSIEPRQAVFSVRAVDEMLSQSLQGSRAVINLIGTLAVLATTMSMAGVFAVVSYLLARRQKEVALRRAVGATGSDVVWLLSSQTLRWTLGGLVAGVAAAVATSRALRATVPNLTELGIPLLATTCVLYLVVVVAAMLVPAVRALRIDPATALRAE